MTLPEVLPDPMAERLSLVRAHLDERAWRLLLGAEAKVLGRGGIRAVSAACGAHPDTVAQGVRELTIPTRFRTGSASRRRPSRCGEHRPGVLAALDALVDPESRGDPESPLRWTIKSTSKLAVELSSRGHKVSARTVAKLLKESGYSLQGNTKTVEGTQHIDRDAQFAYLAERAPPSRAPTIR